MYFGNVCPAAGVHAMISLKAWCSCLQCHSAARFEQLGFPPILILPGIQVPCWAHTSILTAVMRSSSQLTVEATFGSEMRSA